MTTTDHSPHIAAIAELIRLENSGAAQRLQISIGPYSAFVLVSALQLAWRHPDLAPHLQERVEAIAHQVQSRFSGPIAELLDAGWDTDADLIYTPAREIYAYEPISRDLLPDGVEWGPAAHDPAMFGTVAYGRAADPTSTALQPPARGCPWMALTWDVNGETRYYQLSE